MKKNKIKDTNSLMGLGIQFIILEREKEKERKKFKNAYSCCLMFKYTSIPTKVDTCRFVINTNMSEKNFNEIKEHRHSYVCFADSKC